VWTGDAAKIRAAEVRQQKHDRREADSEIAAGGTVSADLDPPGKEKDLRQLLIHRHRLACLCAQVKSQ
jgi:hypothetical protein